jgi:tetratricopeptide (TPR) repeat protein
MLWGSYPLPSYDQKMGEEEQLPIDSVIHNAKLNMYKNPDKLIRLGDSIYKSSPKDSPERVKALMLKINGYTAKRDYEKSLSLLLKAQEIVQKTNDIDLEAQVINRQAIIYQQLKIYDKALENVDRSNEFIRTHKVKNFEFLQANNFLIKGIIYKEQLSCELAINYFNKAIAKYGEGDVKSAYPNLSIAEYNKGQCYSSSQEYDKAALCYKKAATNASTVNANSLEAFALKGLADVYLHQEKYSMAIANLQKALELSKDVGDALLEGTIYHGLAENYLLTGDSKKFMHFRALSLKSQDAIKEAERKATSDSVNGLTNAHKENVNMLNKQFTALISVLACIILAALFFTYRYYIRARKALAGQKKKLDLILGSQQHR